MIFLFLLPVLFLALLIYEINKIKETEILFNLEYEAGFVLQKDPIEHTVTIDTTYEKIPLWIYSKEIYDQLDIDCHYVFVLHKGTIVRAYLPELKNISSKDDILSAKKFNRYEKKRRKAAIKCVSKQAS